MTDIAPVAEKLSKLLPMLATSHEGERLAAVAAVERTLASVGCDWHDLAFALQQQPRESIERNPPGIDAVLWAELSAREKHAWLHALHHADDGLTDWEEEFIASLFARSGRWMAVHVTPRQEDVLNRLLWKAVNRGVRP